MALFPTLADRPSGYLSINELAKREPGPWHDPAWAQQKIDEYHERAGIAYSYGEYLTPRDTVWADIPYLKERNTFLHLAWDFNVPAGTPVALTRPARVVRIDNDHPDEYGWGPRVVVRLKNHPLYLLYAHLSEDVSCKVGQELHAGSYIGKVGETPFNGGWYSHTHIHALTTQAWNIFGPDLNQLDGYGKVEDWALWARRCPDAMPYLRVW